MNVPLSWRHFFDLIGITAFVYLISDFVPLPGASGGSEGSFYILLRYFLKGATSATYLFGDLLLIMLVLFLEVLQCHLVENLILQQKNDKKEITENDQTIVIEDIEEIEFDDFKK